jgi:hypothetical protein
MPRWLLIDEHSGRCTDRLPAVRGDERLCERRRPGRERGPI